MAVTPNLTGAMGEEVTRLALEPSSIPAKSIDEKVRLSIENLGTITNKRILSILKESLSGPTSIRSYVED